MIYLDNAATSYQKPTEFYRAMDKGVRKFSVNAGRGGHYFSVIGADRVSETGEKLAELFGADNPERIAFSYNATMSLNQAIGGILKKGGHAVVTQMEHNSVLRPVHAYGNYTMAAADEKGFVNAENVRSAMREDTKLVVCTHVSNVCGSVQPIKEIADAAHEGGAVFLLDAAQSAGCKAIDVEEMGIDMLAFSAHKGLLGPMGVGGLYVKEGIELEPVILGGTGTKSQSLQQPSEMPGMLQSGTINTPAIAALGVSLDYIKKVTPEAIAEKQTELAYLLIEKLLNIKGVTVYGECERCRGKRNGTVLFNIDKLESGTVGEILNDEYKIAVRSGWHCAYYAHEALGSQKCGGVRASFGAFSKKSEAEKLAAAVNEIVKKYK